MSRFALIVGAIGYACWPIGLILLFINPSASIAFTTCGIALLVWSILQAGDQDDDG